MLNLVNLRDKRWNDVIPFDRRIDLDVDTDLDPGIYKKTQGKRTRCRTGRKSLADVVFLVKLEGETLHQNSRYTCSGLQDTFLCT